MRKLIIKLYKIRILKRLVPSVLKIFVKTVNKYNIIINHNNLLLSLNLRNPIDREIYLRDAYETKQIEYLKKLIIKDKLEIFIDVGSHMGFYSINLSKLIKIIYSFEPILENYNQLKKNIEINDYKNIKTYNLALSNIKKEVEMWVPNKNKTGGFSIYNEKDEELKTYKPNSLHKEKVLSDILDSILILKNKKIAIKIDVERHERNVIEGAVNLLKENDVLLQVEIFESRKEEVFEVLKILGYKLIDKINKDHYFKNY
jgi:FkbM family methyltransferase